MSGVSVISIASSVDLQVSFQSLSRSSLTLAINSRLKRTRPPLPGRMRVTTVTYSVCWPLCWESDAIVTCTSGYDRSSASIAERRSISCPARVFHFFSITGSSRSVAETTKSAPVPRADLIWCLPGVLIHVIYGAFARRWTLPCFTVISLGDQHESRKL